MSITDGLRRYAANWDGFFYDDEDGRLINAIGYVPARSTPVPNVINAIADSIDKQHAKECDKAYAEGVNEGIDADKNAMGYIKLPVDADGEIWTGNERVFEVGNGTRYDMCYLMYDGEKWIIDSSFGGFIANECRHVQPDSWERIIQDALTVGWQNGNWNEVASAEIHDELVERCKRLAGE